jgi:hypothetical protein
MNQRVGMTMHLPPPNSFTAKDQGHAQRPILVRPQTLPWSHIRLTLSSTAAAYMFRHTLQLRLPSNRSCDCGNDKTASSLYIS